MQLAPEIILRLLSNGIKDLMLENKQRLTKDMIDLQILEKVKRVRRLSMSDVSSVS